MASLARTVVHFAGALLLGGIAAVYDTREAPAPRVELLRSGTEARKAPQLFEIQQGKRAVSILLPRTALFEFGIRPNTRVDVIESVRDPNAKERSTPRILLRDVRVLAVMPRPRSTADTASASEMVVTLEVTPEQAKTIALAQAKGAISLALPGSELRR